MTPVLMHRTAAGCPSKRPSRWDAATARWSLTFQIGNHLQPAPVTYQALNSLRLAGSRAPCNGLQGRISRRAIRPARVGNCPAVCAKTKNTEHHETKTGTNG